MLKLAEVVSAKCVRHVSHQTAVKRDNIAKLRPALTAVL